MTLKWNKENSEKLKKIRNDWRAKNKDKIKIQTSTWKESNKIKVKEYASKKHLENQKFINTFKDVPCKDCGLKFHFSAMDFDHIKDDKSNIISHMVQYSRQKIWEEIQKCEVVCSNCHRLRTWKRANKIPISENLHTSTLP